MSALHAESVLRCRARQPESSHFLIRWQSQCQLPIHHMLADSRYLHFQVAPSEQRHSVPAPGPVPLPVPEKLAGKVTKGPAQWVNCDIRSFDFSVLGQ